MSLLSFYTLLVVLGLFLNVVAVVMVNSQVAVEIVTFCVILGDIMLFFGIRGLIGKFKSYM